MKNIILYIRVSTKEQAEKGFSLQTQEKMLRNYFKDYNIIKVIYDTTSGMSHKRKGLDELKTLIPQTNFIGAVDNDRIARDPKVQGLIEYAWCEPHNVKILTIENPNESELVADIKTVVAKDENKKRIERILRNKQTCFENGRHIARPPLGYIYDKNTKPSKLIQDINISIVKKIFEMYRQGSGYLKISKTLNIKNKKQTEYAFLRVKAILHNPFYAGYVQYKDNYKKALHEPIIKFDDFVKIRGNESWNTKINGR